MLRIYFTYPYRAVTCFKFISSELLFLTFLSCPCMGLQYSSFNVILTHLDYKYFPLNSIIHCTMSKGWYSHSVQTISWMETTIMTANKSLHHSVIFVFERHTILWFLSFALFCSNRLPLWYINDQLDILTSTILLSVI